MKVEQLNGANLAFIGDAYYELFIRRHLLEKKITNQKELQKLSVTYVSAKAHHQIISKLSSMLTAEEEAIFKRGRNHKFHGFRKNLKKEEYLSSSGFEAVIGYLYLKGNFERLNELLERSIEIIEIGNSNE
jgi:ribonuclease-3 family protein